MAKASKRGKRYTDQERKDILEFISSRGHGGIKAASKKWGVSYVAIRNWQSDKPRGQVGRPKGTYRATKVVAGASPKTAKRVKALAKSLRDIRKQLDKMQTLVNSLT